MAWSQAGRTDSGNVNKIARNSLAQIENFNNDSAQHLTEYMAQNHQTCSYAIESGSYKIGWKLPLFDSLFPSMCCEVSELTCLHSVFIWCR